MMVAFARPAMVGAILPSSRFLAGLMARAADGAELLIELGAGTGAITEGLRERHPMVPTVVVELQPELAQHLRERFAGIEVRAEPAHVVLDDHLHGPPGAVVVSSLPFRSLPSPWRERTSLAIEHFLMAQPGRRLVQYTYQPRVPFELTHASALQWRRVGVVWRNAPPAWVWELRGRDLGLTDGAGPASRG